MKTIKSFFLFFIFVILSTLIIHSSSVRATGVFTSAPTPPTGYSSSPTQAYAPLLNQINQTQKCGSNYIYHDLKSGLTPPETLLLFGKYPILNYHDFFGCSLRPDFYPGDICPYGLGVQSDLFYTCGQTKPPAPPLCAMSGFELYADSATSFNCIRSDVKNDPSRFGWNSNNPNANPTACVGGKWLDSISGNSFSGELCVVSEEGEVMKTRTKGRPGGLE